MEVTEEVAIDHGLKKEEFSLFAASKMYFTEDILKFLSYQMKKEKNI